VLVCVLCLLPFVGKAFAIDDPLFLWAARHIHQHPTDPYGFDVNWYVASQPMSEVTKNPPLACYYLALAGALFGWSEVALHLAFLLPAAGVAWGTYRVAERLTCRPLLATLAAILTPVFLVSSTTVMCDTMMLCFWVWAIVCWQRGLERPAWLAVAGVLIALSALTKYFGVSLIPLLLAYTLAARKPFRPNLLAMLIPVVVLIAYQVLTQRMYGRGLLTDAAGFSVGARSSFGEVLWAPLIGLAFTGGCVASVLFFLPLLWPWRTLLAGIALASLLLTPALILGRLGPHPVRGEQGWDWLFLLQAWVLVLGGLWVVALIAADLRQKRDADAWLLFLWAAGTLAFGVAVNWVINARSLLALAPAAGILLARRLDRLYGSAPAWSWREAWPLVPAAALALVVTAADGRQANADRDGARAAGAACAGQSGTVWFQGHWGFQLYMQEQGARPTEAGPSRFQPGDFIVLPGNNYGVFFDPFHPESDPTREVLWIEQPLFPGLITMDRDHGAAGFYSHIHGPLPFVFGPVAPVRYRVLQFLSVGL
jgi:hypothetical protein